jgi:membrane protein DedA with SNARE-associated domain
MPEYLLSFTSFVNNLPMTLRLAVIVFASAIEYVFPIFPGDTVVLLSGFLSTQGGLGFLELSLAALTGTIIGCFMAYTIGRAVARGKVAQHWIEKAASKENLASFNAWFNRWGYFLILANRFFFFIRSFFFVAAGLYSLPLVFVIIYGTISAIIFNSCILFLGYLLGNNVDAIISLLDSYSKFSYIALGVFILIFVGIKAQRSRVRRRNARKSKIQDS